MRAIAELYHTLIDVAREGDLRGHLRAWWAVVRPVDRCSFPEPLTILPKGLGYWRGREEAGDA